MSIDNKWHHLTVASIMESFGTDKQQGLSPSAVKKQREAFGSNTLPEKAVTPEWKKFVSHFNDILIYILLVAALVTLILGHYIDTAVILLVAVINAVIGYIQENKAEKALEGIRNLLSLQATVLREGNRAEIDSEHLVPGDIVLLKAGDKVPADVRLYQAERLKAEESPLTGESASVEKQTASLPEETVLGDRTNMVFSGTSISSGTAKGIVVATGEDTEIGQINRSMKEVEDMKTPLLQQIDTFGKMISIVILVLALVLFGFGLIIHDYDWGELLLSVIGLTVAAIPEGLPAILTIILALGVQTMADKKAIMRTLPSVETLGAVTVICSDKTGTLTKNEMTVKSVITRDKLINVTGTGYKPAGELIDEETDKPAAVKGDLKTLLTAMMTVNDAEIQEDEGQWIVRGDPTEGCLITLAEKANHDSDPLDLLSKIPFDSEYKYMAGLVEEEGQKKIYLKGAPDRLLDMADLEAGSQERMYWEEQVRYRSRKGERVIAAAVKEVDSSLTDIDHEDVSSGLTLLGLTGIMDPPREEAIDAVRVCKEAGIQIKMITGDHRETALAIAKQMGITDHDDVIEGRELDHMNEEEIKQAVSQSDVFARTSPNNKLQLVEALQANGHISAMTGDGVNDAPALKRADIGVAMGIKGTEVAKEASEMVLVDDNFSTIVNAVSEGRRVYDNLKKTILFILPTNGAEAFLVMGALLLGLDMPLTPVQILYVNMVTAVTVALALAFEPLEEGSMSKPPRKADEQLLNPYYIFRILFVSLLIGGIVMWMNGQLQQTYSLAHVNTVTLHAIVFAQLFHLFNVRNERHFSLNRHFFENKAAFIVSGLLILFQLAVTYVPFLSEALGLYPIEAFYWLFPIGLGLIVFIVVEIEKYLTHHVFKRK